MTVGELIEMLENYDPEAKVILMTQENWPFENALVGVTSREEMHDDGEDEDDDVATQRDGSGELAPSDVFLVEGQQLRYGSKAAWHAVR
jgi:hypothetical protein